MKILKIFGIVVGIHLFALILIFANPGCSSTSKPPPPNGETQAAASPTIATPAAATGAPMIPAEASPGSSAITFNPDAPASAAPVADPAVRFSPTRPNSAVASAPLIEPVADVTPAMTYTVKAGDNLWTIAKKNNLTVAQITAANRLSANTSLRPGQKLILPKSGAAAAPVAGGTTGSGVKTTALPAPAAVKSSGGDVVKHVVKSGETLGAIARRYDVRQGDIAVANNIADPAKIRPGMELIIPGWQSPGSKSVKSTKSTGAKSSPSTLPPPPDFSAPATEPASPPPVPVIRIDDNSASSTRQP